MRIISLTPPQKLDDGDENLQRRKKKKEDPVGLGPERILSRNYTAIGAVKTFTVSSICSCWVFTFGFGIRVLSIEEDGGDELACVWWVPRRNGLWPNAEDEAEEQKETAMKEVWSSLEQRTQEILLTIQPNVESELRRRIFTNYVQGLLVCHLPPELALQFYSFGSFPLKAYLPDGDIDLTALCRPNLMEGLARKICTILRSRQPQDSEFQIKDVRYIRARVKVVKCFVNNMAVDISFNQTAGLSTLCFLEKVDQLIGKDHLYKKCVILTKAWCYYESRIFGAQYGLIASYGLETLVLFIINRFHSSLRGPLEVLHRFLEYYSTFDWRKYGISINGPFALSSLPEIIVTPQNEGEEFLLSEEFVRECRLAFPDPLVANAARVDEFQIKFLNIVDPLKDNNNLGRSVSKGNFCRIRSAFSLGAKKLREVLMLPGERRGMTLEKFFATTLDRNGGGQRADLATPVPAFGTGTSEKSDLTGDYEEYCDSLLSANAYQFSITHNGAPPFEAEDMSKSNALVHTAQQDGNVISQMAQNADQIFSFRLPHLVMQNQNNSTNASPRARGRVPESSSCGLRMKSPQKTKTNQVEVSTNVSPSVRGKIPESSSCGPRMKSPQETNQVEVSTEAGPSENAPQFKFSPEEFPQLPGTQIPSSSEVHQSAQTELASPLAKEFPQVTAATICFKRFTLDNDNDFPPLTYGGTEAANVD